MSPLVSNAVHSPLTPTRLQEGVMGGQPIRIMMIAGEASGDLHGGALASTLLKRDPTLQFIGIGGPAMKKAGVSIQFNIENLGIVGLLEVLPKCVSIFKAYQTAKTLLKNKVDLLVLIDFPDFNLRVAKVAKNLGIPVVYYIGPQIWAWRASRIKTIKERVDLMLVLFPFEANLYRKADIPSECVGHPLWDEAAPILKTAFSKSDYLKEKGLNSSAITVGLLPGSRKSEIERHLPIMLKAMELLSKEIASLQILVPVAPTIKTDWIRQFSNRSPLSLRFVEGEIYSVLRSSDATVVASGTATLQVALTQTPMVVIYKLSKITYALAKRLVHISRIGLVNIVAETDLVPELIQDEATPDRICHEIKRILTDKTASSEMSANLARVADSLKTEEAGASHRAAEFIYRFLTKSIEK